MAARSRSHEHPVAPSDSHNKGCSPSRAARGAHGPNPAAALRMSRAQLDKDTVVGACPGSSAGAWVARDGRAGKLGLLPATPKPPLGCSSCWFSPTFQGPCKTPQPHMRGCAGCSMPGRCRARLTLPAPVPSSGRKRPGFTLTHPSRLLQTAPLPASPPASTIPAAPPTRPATTASAASGSGRACPGECTARPSCLWHKGRQSQCQRRQGAQGTSTR